GAALEIVVLLLAEDLVAALVAEDLVVADAAADDVLAAAAVDDVVAAAAADDVVLGAAEDLVVAVAAVVEVAAAAEMDGRAPLAAFFIVLAADLRVGRLVRRRLRRLRAHRADADRDHDQRQLPPLHLPAGSSFAAVAASPSVDRSLIAAVRALA